MWTPSGREQTILGIALRLTRPDLSGFDHGHFDSAEWYCTVLTFFFLLTRRTYKLGANLDKSTLHSQCLSYPAMSIARCVSKIMDRIAPLTLAEKWDNVSSFSLIHRAFLEYPLP